MSHGTDGANKAVAICDRQGAGLADADKSLRLAARRLNLGARRMRWRQNVRRGGVKDDAVERR